MISALISLSASGSALALMLLALKPLIKRMLSKGFAYYVWLIVLIRLVLPVSAPINIMETLFHDDSLTVQSVLAGADAYASVNSEAAYADNADMPFVAPASSINNGSALWEPIKRNGIVIWALGALIGIAWNALSYARLLSLIRKNSSAVLPEDEAIFKRLCPGGRVALVRNDNIKAPVLVGLLRPVIIIPALAYVRNGMGVTLENMLRHELVHFRHKDIAYKWFVTLVTCVHWFNPLIYIVRREIFRACELACDEAVIQGMTLRERRSYGSTLISLAANGKSSADALTAMLCNSGSQLKERIVSIMKCNKKTKLTLIFSILLALALTGCGVMLGVTANGNRSGATLQNELSDAENPMRHGEVEWIGTYLEEGFQTPKNGLLDFNGVKKAIAPIADMARTDFSELTFHTYLCESGERGGKFDIYEVYIGGSGLKDYTYLVKLTADSGIPLYFATNELRELDLRNLQVDKLHTLADNERAMKWATSYCAALYDEKCTADCHIGSFGALPEQESVLVDCRIEFANGHTYKAEVKAPEYTLYSFSATDAY